MPLVGGFSYTHMDLESGILGLYRQHVSDISLVIFRLGLQAMVELAIGGFGPLLT